MKGRVDKTGRTKNARHVRIYHVMLRSEAWKSLSPVARVIYIEIASRYRGLGSNNGRIPYSIREGAASAHCGKSKAADALLELQNRGFIVAVTRGGFNRKNRHATEWRVTEFVCDVTGTKATNDYLDWRPLSPFQNTGSNDGRKVSLHGQHGISRRPMGTSNGTYPPLTVSAGGQAPATTVPERGHH